MCDEPGGEGRAGGSTEWRDGQEVAKHTHYNTDST